MNRGCGCQTAEQCWKSCCCSTQSERLAWAREHGVEPPEFLVTAAADAHHETTSPDQSGGCHKCHSCAKAKAAAKTRSCCSSQPPRKHIDWIIGVRAQECQGLTLIWANAQLALPAPPAITIAPPSICAGESLPALLPFSFFLDRPPIPPPRV